MVGANQTENYQILLAKLRGAHRQSHVMLIGIEGRMNAGKSCSAKQPANDLGHLPPVHLDDFRAEPIPDLPYLPTLDISLLAAHLNDRRQDFPTTPFIIEGICLREALDAIGRELDLAIYVKRLSQTGLWHTQFDLEDFENTHGRMYPKFFIWTKCATTVSIGLTKLPIYILNGQKTHLFNCNPLAEADGPKRGERPRACLPERNAGHTSRV
jgi:hypothetical protein